VDQGTALITPGKPATVEKVDTDEFHGTQHVIPPSGSVALHSAYTLSLHTTELQCRPLDLPYGIMRERRRFYLNVV
jgi:hypothetical protein